MYDHNGRYQPVRLHTVPARLLVIDRCLRLLTIHFWHMKGNERDII